MTSRNSKKRRKPRAAVVVLWLLCAVCAGALAALCWHMFAPQTPAESTALPASTVSAQPAASAAGDAAARLCHRG